jgi:hypothetical protein
MGRWISVHDLTDEQVGSYSMSNQLVIVAHYGRAAGGRPAGRFEGFHVAAAVSAAQIVQVRVSEGGFAPFPCRFAWPIPLHWC